MDVYVLIPKSGLLGVIHHNGWHVATKYCGRVIIAEHQTLQGGDNISMCLIYRHICNTLFLCGYGVNYGLWFDLEMHSLQKITTKNPSKPSSL